MLSKSFIQSSIKRRNLMWEATFSRNPQPHSQCNSIWVLMQGRQIKVFQISLGQLIQTWSLQVNHKSIKFLIGPLPKTLQTTCQACTLSKLLTLDQTTLIILISRLQLRGFLAILSKKCLHQFSTMVKI